MVLNQLYPSNEPRLVTTGRTGKDISDEFKFNIANDIEVHFTCAVNLKGEIFIYGGDHFDKQVILFNYLKSHES